MSLIITNTKTTYEFTFKYIRTIGRISTNLYFLLYKCKTKTDPIVCTITAIIPKILYYGNLMTAFTDYIVNLTKTTG